MKKSTKDELGYTAVARLAAELIDNNLDNGRYTTFDFMLKHDLSRPTARNGINYLIDTKVLCKKQLGNGLYFFRKEVSELHEEEIELIKGNKAEIARIANIENGKKRDAESKIQRRSKGESRSTIDGIKKLCSNARLVDNSINQMRYMTYQGEKK